MEKVCNTCNINKSLSEFYKDKARKDGLKSKCKECFKIHNKQYKQDNKEAIDEYSKQYNQDNKEAIDEYYQQYRQDNKEAIAEYNQQYKQDNKEAIDEYSKQYNQDNKEYKDEYNLQQAMSEGYGVYKLTHLPTQYFYIGEGQIYRRRHQHLNMLKKGNNPWGLLQEHYNKHPNIDEWQFEVIYKFDDYDKETGRELEAFVIEESREKYPTQILNKNS